MRRALPNPLNYSPPPEEAFPPLPRRVWWARLIILSIFGLFALFGFAIVASLAFALLTELWSPGMRAARFRD